MAIQLALTGPAVDAPRPAPRTTVAAGWLWMAFCVAAALVVPDLGSFGAVLPVAAFVTFGWATGLWCHRIGNRLVDPRLLPTSMSVAVVAAMGLVALSVSATDGQVYVGLEALLAMTIFASGSLLLSLSVLLFRRDRRPTRDAVAAVVVGVLAMTVWVAVGADLLLVPWSACACLLLLKR